jgi:hypothetical protein
MKYGPELLGCSAMSSKRSEIEFQRELNQPWVVAGRIDVPEFAWISFYLASVLINVFLGDGVEVADRVRKVYVIEEIEKLDSELDVL